MLSIQSDYVAFLQRIIGRNLSFYLSKAAEAYSNSQEGYIAFISAP